MTPAKLLIAQRLMEVAVELRSIVALMDEYRNDPAWWRHTRDLEDAAVLMRYMAESIRGAEHETL